MRGVTDEPGVQTIVSQRFKLLCVQHRALKGAA